MHASFNIGWDFPSTWTKYGRLRKAWWFHPWCGCDDYGYYIKRYTIGIRVLGFEVSADLTL